jgi:basic amino acid/polyamine antiporter, APA family
VYSGLVLALFMALSLSTIFRLRSAHSGTKDLYRAPLYPLLPAVLVAGAFSLVAYSLLQRPTESLWGAATVLSGIPLYLFWKGSGSSKSSEPTRRQKRKI